MGPARCSRRGCRCSDKSQAIPALSQIVPGRLEEAFGGSCYFPSAFPSPCLSSLFAFPISSDPVPLLLYLKVPLPSTCLVSSVISVCPHSLAFLCPPPCPGSARSLFELPLRSLFPGAGPAGALRRERCGARDASSDAGSGTQLGSRSPVLRVPCRCLGRRGICQRLCLTKAPAMVTKLLLPCPSRGVVYGRVETFWRLRMCWWGWADLAATSRAGGGELGWLPAPGHRLLKHPPGGGEGGVKQHQLLRAFQMAQSWYCFFSFKALTLF